MVRQSRPPQRFLPRYYPTILMCGIGTASFVAGIAQQATRDGFAGLLVFLGVASYALGALAPRLLNIELGPSGLKASLGDEQQVEESTRFLSGENPAPDELEEEDDRVIAARTALAGVAIASLLDAKEGGELASARLHLYLFDQEAELLVPVSLNGDPPASPLESFRIGCGATGEAYASGQYIIVSGPAVADGTYGLTPAQQAHFRNLTAVAAMPVENAAGDVLGVLTATTEEPIGPSHLLSDDAKFEMLSLSLLIGRALVDLLRWFGDGP